MLIDIEKLRTTAINIVAIPDHYRLEMDDNIPKGDEQEHCFIWEDPGNEDNNIEVTFDLFTGHLTGLVIEREEMGEVNEDEAKQICLDDEARAVADTFVARHAPNSTEFTSVFIEKTRSGITFKFRQEAGGLPLPGTGCDLMLDAGLNVVRYRLNGRWDHPEWPAAIVDEETVKRYIRSNLRMMLTIVSLHPSMYEMNRNEQEYRLVYMPIPEHQLIDAVTGLDLFSPEHYVMPPSGPLPLMKTVSNLAKDEKVSWEHWLGINLEHYVLKKSSDDGGRIKYWYQLTEQEEEKPDTNALSLDAYMQRKWGNQLSNIRDSSIIVQLEKTTGRLVGFHRMNCGKEGAPKLSREQCWNKAAQFLNNAFPDYAHYLQLENDQEKSDGEPREREFFYLPVYMDGISVNLERITISVCTSTGDICTYMGVSYEMIRELTGRKFQSGLTSEAAIDCYVEQMKLRLNWYKDHNDDQDQEIPVFRLLYEPTTMISHKQGNERKLRYIDAITGEFIWGRH
ncbi:YcdB/YcdC domain-containing protein [Paenibacillus sp. IHBB 10380]|uniref:YcdB/YcdC domain-containing protein n=1 Tax=Paenibacillus sp. IHBB 10380 TaxID=1566358 RepID=UPI0005CFE321|nr:YcdB/YcdC domain-containing protein [Paenibacillus sp. IHBB 10380]AJS58890.1 hypothetical protein UB51_10830 [Paenibacillus sp. IHBB 10380]